eukprot:scaffold2413_cov44-Attheya_sp.AAC.3
MNKRKKEDHVVFLTSADAISVLIKSAGSAIIRTVEALRGVNVRGTAKFTFDKEATEPRPTTNAEAVTAHEAANTIPIEYFIRIERWLVGTPNTAIDQHVLSAPHDHPFIDRWHDRARSRNDLY